MLAEHLSQDHDAASRRVGTIDEQAHWIHHDLLAGEATRILDLACGSGLYTSRLARLGHTAHGIDFAPAAIAYAREQAASEGLACTYLQQDLREAALGANFGLVMMLSGQVERLQALRGETADRGGVRGTRGGWIAAVGAADLRRRGRRAGCHDIVVLSFGGSLLVAAALFSSQLHFVLTERFWDEATTSSTERFLVIDAATGDVTRHALTNEAYSDDQLSELLTTAGFEDVRLLPSLTGIEDASQAAFQVVVARKPA